LLPTAKHSKRYAELFCQFFLRKAEFLAVRPDYGGIAVETGFYGKFGGFGGINNRFYYPYNGCAKIFIIRIKRVLLS